uniref:Tafazzin family protein n=1 Tax=Blastobotrys adeninivorans TaxID=409370 RepID=A0A060TGF0_BLAAD
MSFPKVHQRGWKFLADYSGDSLWFRLQRKATMAATGLWARAMVKNVYDTKYHNLDTLLEAYKTSKIENRGLLTIMNHTSVLDEPLCWGLLPLEHLLYPRRMRWTLGAENICFRNKFVSKFFSLGQVLSTRRFGAGPFQDSIDASICLLSRERSSGSYKYSPSLPRFRSSGDIGANVPQWVHTFPESIVHQPVEPYNNTLRYFKWGVSRLVLEPTVPPIIVPIFTKGLEKVMPEHISKHTLGPIGAKIDFAVGDPIDDNVIADLRRRWLDLVHEQSGPDAQLDEMPESLRTGEVAQALRSETASVLRDSVVRASAIFDLPKDQARMSDPQFWKSDTRDIAVRTVNDRITRNQHR